MNVDVSSLLIAIVFVGAALALTTLVIWLGARRFGYLLFWGTGLVVCIPAVVMLALLLDPYSPAINFVAFALLLSGIVLIQAASTHFRTGSVKWVVTVVAWIVSIAATGVPFALGLSGLGVIVLNICCGALFIATAWEYWCARREAPGPLVGISALYLMMALSFFLCVIPLVDAGTYVLTARQENWAEDINSITIVGALSGIGALMLATAQNRSTQEQRKKAASDPLTGLFNRGAIFEIANRSKLAPGTAVIMFDLDHFKAINDTFGHAAGDEVLRRFAEVLSKNVRSSDATARVGGEEFCVLLYESSASGAYEVADRIRSEFASSHGTEKIAATVSAGVALGVGDTGTFEALLKSADEALYRAKSSGRNCVLASSPRLVA